MAQTDKVILDSLSELELSFSFTNLPTKYPSLIIRLHIQHTTAYTLHDQVVIHLGSNTEEATKMYLPLFPKAPKNIKIEVQKSDHKGKRLLLEATICPYELLEAPKRSLAFPFLEKGSMVLSWAAPEETSSDVYISVESLGLKVPGSWFSRSETQAYFKLARSISFGEEALLYTSEPVSIRGFASWNRFRVKSSDLCKGDKRSPIKLSLCSKAIGNGSSERVLGEGMFSLEQLILSQNVIPLADENKQKSIGNLRMTCEINNASSFNDYIRAGLKFNTMLALDFSDSQHQLKGLRSTHSPKSKKSPSTSSDYLKIIHELWPFLSQANTTSKIPYYSLGGGVNKKSPNETSMSRGSLLSPKMGLSNLSLSLTSPKSGTGKSEPEQPWVSSLSDALRAYEDMVVNGKLGGKCRLGEVIERAKYMARFNQLYKSQEYVILVIVTDGYIEDYEQTERNLKRLASLPMSVVFVNAGDGESADFESLESSLEKEGKRPCVSFLQYRNVKNEVVVSGREVVQEVTEHLTEYVVKKDRKQSGESMESLWSTEASVEAANNNNSHGTTPTNNDNRENLLRGKVPPMVKEWICQTNRKEFMKAKEMIDKAIVEFGSKQAF